MFGNVTKETLGLLKEALATGDPSILLKAGAGQGWTAPGGATTGLTAYALEEPSKKLFPVLTPLRNAIPRASGGEGVQANWRAVIGINTANMNATVSEGNRGGVVTSSTQDFIAAFRGIGLEDSVSMEGWYASEGFEDLRALAAANLLKALMIAEEALLLGGQGTWALGKGNKPVGAKKAGGAMAAQATVAYVVPLTYEGYLNTLGNLAVGVKATVAKTLAGPYGGTDTVNGGVGIVSDECDTPVTTETSNLSVLWTTKAVAGAFAYAWYTGLTGAGNCSFTAVTKTNSFLQLADAAGSQKANFTGYGSDHSQNSLAFDGLIAIATKSGANGYYKSYDGAALTGDGAGGVAEFDAALSDRWDNYRLGFTDCYVSGSDIQAISKSILASGSAPIYRIELNEGQAHFSGGGMIAKDYLNKITGERIALHVHPNLPAGKALFLSSTLPYPLSGVPQVIRVLARQEYYAIEWPRVKRAYEYGVYADEVLQHYAPFSMGIVDNFAGVTTSS